MLNRIPLRKSYLLAAFTVLLILLSVRLAFQKTYLAWQFSKELTGKLEQSADLTYQPGYLEQKSHNIDKILSLYKVDTIAYRNNVLSALSFIAEKENVKIVDVPFIDSSPYYKTEHFKIQKLIFEEAFFL